MHRDPLLRTLVACCGAFVVTACAYVLCLLAGFSLGLAIPAVATTAGVWLFLWLRHSRTVDAAPVDVRMLFVAAIVTAACCVMIKEHGAYDAWLHWNSLAKYLSDPAYFRMLHKPDSLWHADYPPGLTAPIGFVWRILGTDPEWVPRMLSFLFYLPIPLLLCRFAMQTSGPRYLWLAVLALFTINYECVSQGLNQYADIPLALLFLLALMCWNSWTEGGERHWLIACGLMLGGCLLLKNEGAVIVMAFLLSRIRAFLNRRSTWLLFLSLILPVTVLVLYKRYIPTPNDVVAGLGPQRVLQFLDPARYRIIGYNLLRFGIGRFPLFLLFFGWTAWLRRPAIPRMGPDLRCLLLCAAGYLLVYLSTDIGLEWLVPTSMNRLMMQLLPAGVYVAVNSLRTADSSMHPDGATGSARG